MGSYPADATLGNMCSSSSKGSAASTQWPNVTTHEGFVRQAWPVPTRPRPGEVDQVHPGKLPRVTGALQSLPRTHRGLPGTADGRTRERRSTLLRSPPEV